MLLLIMFKAVMGASLRIWYAQMNEECAYNTTIYPICIGRKVDTISDLHNRVVKIKHHAVNKEVWGLHISDNKKELQSSSLIATQNEQSAEENSKLTNKLIGWVLMPTLIVLLAWFARHDIDKV